MIIKQNVQLSPDISIMENMGLENWDTVIADCDELLEKYIAGEPMDKEELLREENRRIQASLCFRSIMQCQGKLGNPTTH